jgi:hypothetical protein
MNNKKPKNNKYKLSNNIHKKLKNQKLRKQMLEKCGDKAFLLPDKLKFPVMIPGGNCKVNKKLLHAAYVRARQFQSRKPGYREVALKAKSMLRH